jgi:acetoin utilization deacetylase AcuC-like enzyme
LYISTHEWPLYPGTGGAEETGGPAAAGLTMNIPLPAGATGDVLLKAADEAMAPVVERFDPTWVLVSAGFDAHRADPLAELALSAGDFGLLAQDVAEFAPRAGRMVAFLEGGYDLDALRTSVASALRAWAGAEPDDAEPGTSGGPGTEAVAGARQAWARARDLP